MTTSINRFRRIAAVGAAAAALLGTAPSQALTINLVDLGGVTGSQSEQGFRIAADYWESVFSTNVTLNLGVKYAALAPNVIGSTGSTMYEAPVEDIIAQLGAVGNSALDAAAVLPTLSAATFADPFFGNIHGIDMIRNAPIVAGLGSNPGVSQWDNSLTMNNARLVGTQANLKALGYGGFGATRDADVTFSSAFAFDFNPMDGITAGEMDFIGVAIHEIGHALGFTSGVDFYDANAFVGANFNDYAGGEVLDLFRYSNDPQNVAPGAGPALDWSIGGTPFFSIDGGATVFGGDAYFSTGYFNGDGRQASHFKDALACGGQIGIMDPTFCYGQMGEITADDLAAFDAIGWNINFDVLANMGYKITTAEIYRAALPPSPAVPEPATWAMMIGGFALAGSALRRRKVRVAFA